MRSFHLNPCITLFPLFVHSNLMDTSSSVNFRNIVNNVGRNCIPHLLRDVENSKNLYLSDSSQPILISLIHRNSTSVPSPFDLWLKNKLFRLFRSRPLSPFCRFLVISLKFKIPMTLEDSRYFGDIIHQHSFEYFDTGQSRSDFVPRTLIGQIYVLLLLRTWDIKILLEQSSDFPLFLLGHGFNLANFAVLFLPTSSKGIDHLCVKKFENSVPFIQNMDCARIPNNANYISFYKTTKIPWDWVASKYEPENHHNGFHASSQIIHTILSFKLNLTIFDATQNRQVQLNLGCLSYAQYRVHQECFREIVEPEIQDIYFLTHHRSLVVTRSSKYNFITCYATPTLRFAFYISPFQPLVWICIIICLLTLIITGELVIAIKFKSVQNCTSSISFYFIATIFERVAHIPSVLLGTRGTNFFRIFLGVWLISVTSLTTSYKSLIISTLNSPAISNYPTSFEVTLICEDTLNDFVANKKLVFLPSGHCLLQFYR